jgi:hypothetical protein
MKLLQVDAMADVSAVAGNDLEAVQPTSIRLPNTERKQ